MSVMAHCWQASTCFWIPQQCDRMPPRGYTSITGRSHTFDARADGYARGESANVMVCTRGGADADPPQRNAQLLGSAIRQDGRSASLTAPSGRAQQGLLAASHHDAGMAPAELTVLEAHGTGTALGDPIEAGSTAGAILGREHGHRLEPLAVGSLKANAGHTEPAAGLAGALKLLMQLRTACVAPNAHLRVLNPMVASALTGNAACTLGVQLWTVAHAMAMASGGVSSFGYSGTIGHLVMRSGALQTARKKSARSQTPFQRRKYAWRQAGRAAAPVHPYGLYECRWKNELMPSSVSTERGAQAWLVIRAPHAGVALSWAVRTAVERWDHLVTDVSLGADDPDVTSLSQRAWDLVLLPAELATTSAPSMRLARSLLWLAHCGSALRWQPRVVFLTCGRAAAPPAR